MSTIPQLSCLKINTGKTSQVSLFCIILSLLEYMTGQMPFPCLCSPLAVSSSRKGAVGSRWPGPCMVLRKCLLNSVSMALAHVARLVERHLMHLETKPNQFFDS